MNKNKNILLIVVIALITGAYFIGQNSNSSVSSDDSKNLTVGSTIAASNDEMIQSCQSIADKQLRTGAYESSAYSSINARQSIVSDTINYNASRSTCYFTEKLIYYPSAEYITTAGELTNPLNIETNYLYAAPMQPDGILQDLQNVGYCTTNTYKDSNRATETTCFDFQLSQSGAGTSNYKHDSLGVGVKISQVEYKALVQKYMQGL